MAEPEEISFVTEIERLADADPFRPFTIGMSSGARYTINAGDADVIRGSVITLMVRHVGQQLLRRNQITELEIPEEVK